MNEQQKSRLNEIAVWEPQNFPNGSSYRMQALPPGHYGDVVIERSPLGDRIAWFEDAPVVGVRSDRTPVGPGVDLGIHFNSRDQALTDLL